MIDLLYNNAMNEFTPAIQDLVASNSEQVCNVGLVQSVLLRSCFSVSQVTVVSFVYYFVFSVSTCVLFLFQVSALSFCIYPSLLCDYLINPNVPQLSSLPRVRKLFHFIMSFARLLCSSVPHFLLVHSAY